MRSLCHGANAACRCARQCVSVYLSPSLSLRFVSGVTATVSHLWQCVFLGVHVSRQGVYWCASQACRVSTFPCQPVSVYVSVHVSRCCPPPYHCVLGLSLSLSLCVSPHGPLSLAACVIPTMAAGRAAGRRLHCGLPGGPARAPIPAWTEARCARQGAGVCVWAAHRPPSVCPAHIDLGFCLCPF